MILPARLAMRQGILDVQVASLQECYTKEINAFVKNNSDSMVLFIVTLECDSSCKTCNGPDHTHCTSCHAPRTYHAGQCMRNYMLSILV